MTELSFHHVGIVTPDIEKTGTFYEGLGYRASPRFDDPLQKVTIVLLTRGDGPMVEIVCPASPDSAAAGWVKRIKVGPYHTCYEVASIPASMEWLRDRGFAPVSEPSPAVAFEMRRVVFMWSRVTGLLELLEAHA